MFNEGLKELKRIGEYDKIIKEYVVDGLEFFSDFFVVDELIFFGFI